MPQAERDGAARCARDLAKLKLKYECVTAAADRSLDTIADLQLETRRLEAAAGCRARRLADTEQRLAAAETGRRARDTELAAWRRQAPQLAAELSRARAHAAQQEARVAQLRNLLVKQTEVMHLQELRGAGGVRGSDDDYEEGDEGDEGGEGEERVSEV